MKQSIVFKPEPGSLSDRRTLSTVCCTGWRDCGRCQDLWRNSIRSKTGFFKITWSPWPRSHPPVCRASCVSVCGRSYNSLETVFLTTNNSVQFLQHCRSNIAYYYSNEMLFLWHVHFVPYLYIFCSDKCCM